MLDVGDKLREGQTDLAVLLAFSAEELRLIIAALDVWCSSQQVPCEALARLTGALKLTWQRWEAR